MAASFTESILPLLIGNVFNEFVFGLGVRAPQAREVTLKDGGIDEMRFFNTALSRCLK